MEESWIVIIKLTEERYKKEKKTDNPPTLFKRQEVKF